ncbi:MAG: 3-oxoacyl-ACP reductase [Alphaproteobacteria bacterium HGW-Alphaproteobacteria-5]|nr:MAG: 3-oxoacyl-ACP reductase [Alphaproteobacteria bacterium HGW-Alphaproteobacteria-5]
MDRLAVVTGGSTGIGRQLVKAFAREGFRVAFSYRSSPDAAESLLAEIGQGDRVRSRRCDVGDEAEVEQFYQWVETVFGVPDVLVNNAGIQTWSSLLDLSADDWNAVIRTNLTGCFLNTRAVARRMENAGRPGSIINIGSGCNKLAFPKLVDYTASKGGIEQFTKVSAVELGPLGIRVNCVAPGAITTERTDAEADNYSESWSRVTPLRRVGTPDDVAGSVLFFASAASAFVTGQTLWVDGGVFTQANWAY